MILSTNGKNETEGKEERKGEDFQEANLTFSIKNKKSHTTSGLTLTLMYIAQVMCLVRKYLLDSSL